MIARHSGNRDAQALRQRGHHDKVGIAEPGPPCSAAAAGAVRMSWRRRPENPEGLGVIDDDRSAEAADGIEVVTDRRHPAAAGTEPVGQHDRAATTYGGYCPA